MWFKPLVIYPAAMQAMDELRVELLEAFALLEFLHRHWKAGEKDRDKGPELPASEFYNLEVSEHLHLAQEYFIWQEWQVL